MKRSLIITVIIVLSLNGLVRAEVSLLEELLSKTEDPVAIAIMDILEGRKQVMPSMIPPEIYNKLHILNEAELLHLEDVRKTVFYGRADFDTFKFGYELGKVGAITDLLYATGILSNPKLTVFKRPGTTFEPKIELIPLAPSRLRALATMLLLLDYKEKNPIGPDKFIIPVTADK